MRLHIAGAVAAIAIAFLAFPFAGSVGLLGSPVLKPVLASPFLKVSDDKGHGSGVHIGNGYILTAAHVLGDRKTMTITDSEHRELPGEVLWKNTEYDIALMRVVGFANIDVAELSCAPNYAHQRVTVHGNPRSLDFAFTSGEVNGAARQWAVWKSVVPVDLTIIPGQSGGAVVDANGYVVGIAVGVMTFQMGLTGQGFFVPGSVVCDLMGRA